MGEAQSTSRSVRVEADKARHWVWMGKADKELRPSARARSSALGRPHTQARQGLCSAHLQLCAKRTAGRSRQLSSNLFAAVMGGADPRANGGRTAGGGHWGGGRLGWSGETTPVGPE
eukprot:6433635-Amphidinium_carterae.1